MQSEFVEWRYRESVEPSATPRRPLLLVPGWGESSGVFDRLVELLPPRLVPVPVNVPVNVPAPANVREHERTGARATSYAVPDLARGLADVLMGSEFSAPNLAGPVVVGTSSGGYLAQQVAVDHPELVSGLVLVGSPSDLRGRPPFADEVRALTDPVDPEWVRHSLTWFPRHHDVPQWYIEDRVRDGQRLSAQVWRATFEGLCAATPPIERGPIRAPTLIIHGERDDLLGLGQAQALVQAIPAASLVTYPDTGHLVLWECPDRVAADIVAFVDTLTESSPSSTP